MTHTRRAYQNPNYHGRGWRYFKWIHTIGKPWKQMTNEEIVDHKELGIPKRVMSKKRRLFYKKDLQDQIKKCFLFFPKRTWPCDCEVYYNEM